ncbi:hypothetical protein FRC17_001475, partial [Serendipita sp. 399]
MTTSTTVPATTVFCLIIGEDTPFSVTIQPKATIDELKKNIKDETRTLANVDHKRLLLYKVNIPDDDSLMETAMKFTLDPKSVLKATKRLSTIFPEPPPEDAVHLLVNISNKAPPKILPTGIASLGPLSRKRDEEAKSLIKNSILRLQVIISAYLRDDVRLPIWNVQRGPDEMRRHIDNLKIPVVDPSSPSPSLLLHNLGQPSHDPLLAERVDRLFRPGSGLTFLCNASGSGKTRLLLEGLWRNWGFYFISRHKLDDIRSSDFKQILKDMETGLIPLTDENHATVQRQNLIFASYHLRLLLYIRFLVFRIYLECASALPGGMTEDHKRRWLLLQVAPETLLGNSDVFLEQVQILRGASCDLLDLHMVLECRSIRELIGPLPIFCVLDEAQVLSNKFADCFQSDTEPATGQPILRQVIREWKSRVSELIVSGTGVPSEEVRPVFTHAVAKIGYEPEMITDLGAYDNEEDQRAYFKQYLPQGFLDTDPGKAVASRAGYWLHGR